jgi:hypothetical protein
MREQNTELIDEIKGALATLDERQRTSRGITLYLLGKGQAEVAHPAYFRKLAGVYYYLNRLDIAKNPRGIFTKIEVDNAVIWSLSEVRHT